MRIAGSNSDRRLFCKCCVALNLLGGAMQRKTNPRAQLYGLHLVHQSTITLYMLADETTVQHPGDQMQMAVRDRQRIITIAQLLARYAEYADRFVEQTPAQLRRISQRMLKALDVQEL